MVRVRVVVRVKVTADERVVIEPHDWRRAMLLGLRVGFSVRVGVRARVKVRASSWRRSRLGRLLIIALDEGIVN